MPSFLNFAIASSISGVVLLIYLFFHIRERKSRVTARMAEAQKVLLLTAMLDNDTYDIRDRGRRRIIGSRSRIRADNSRSGRQHQEVATEGHAEDTARHRGLLDEAWSSLDKGQPMKALESVLNVVRDQSGELGVWKTLTETRVQELRRRAKSRAPGTGEKEQHAIPARAELTPKFEALKDSRPGYREVDPSDSVLGEYGDGRDSVIQSAAASASSFVCRRCGGVVAQKRRAAHYEMWCPGLS